MNLNVNLSRDEKMFLVDTLTALRDSKARIGKKHYRTTISRSQMSKMIREFE